MWRGRPASKRIVLVLAALVLAAGALWTAWQTIPNAKAQGRYNAPDRSSNQQRYNSRGRSNNQGRYNSQDPNNRLETQATNS